ncbi:MAG TPA: hypothetical protein DC006_04550 [Prevotellaceae bacterium]|nr:hypothetical protein [Prevotellaceae bacterium]
MSGVIGGVLISTGCCVVLPIMAVWLTERRKMHETDKRTEIALAAIERNPGMNVEDFMRSLQPRQKTIKERLYMRLSAGLSLCGIGLGLLLYALYRGLSYSWTAVDVKGMALSGSVFCLLGLGFIIAYRMGKRMFRKELEAGE